MEATVISIVLGFVIVAACLGIPQLVRIRTQRPDEDAYGYLLQSGQPPEGNSQPDAASPPAADDSQGSSRRPGGQ